jgi:hypothetical protein
MIQSISQDAYNRNVERAIKSQPIRKTVPLASVEIENQNIVRVDGNRLPITKKAFSQLARILGVPVTFQKRVDKLFSEEATSSIVNKMKEAMAIQGINTVCLVASVIDKQIVAVLRNEKEIISNKAFFESIEGVISDHKLIIRDFSVNSSGGVYINTLSPTSGWDIAGFKDEYFQGGMSFFNNTEDGFKISPYMNRLVCLNGAIGEAFAETHRVKHVTNSYLADFYDTINRFAKKGFKPTSFDERVKTAMNTMASYAELEAAAELITSTSGLERKDISRWNSIVDTSSAYERHGMSPMLMNPDQKKNAKTGTPIWDMINGLTHYSTHDSGVIVGEEDRRLIQREAGAIFCAKHDMENVISSPF